ncbi:MAG: RagB/SusD family nutrient uptake outer membrane protein [Tannerellaceae bacterium]|nr:RagB/SusD family nutrient uptake outer membrane protein [Tannerellaceae bacterium]
MKYTYLLCPMIAGLFACSSNDDFLKEKLNGKIFPEYFYSNQDELDLANNALYHDITQFYAADYDGLLMLMGGDDITTPYFGNVDYIPYDIYLRPAGSPHIETGWGAAYAAINVANGIINNYHKAAGTVDEQTLREYAGQAYFVRAYVYFWLVRFFNEIPYITTARVMDKTILKSSAEAVYDSIISDLKKAEEWLPYRWTDVKSLAGFTKGAVKATLASVYLTMAGYPLNKQEYYGLARDKAAELINNQSEYGYRLLDNFADLWKPTPLTNDELVFGLFYNKAIQANARAPKSCRPVQFGGWELYCPEINFFKRFPEGKRKEATFVWEFPLETGFYTDVPILPWPESRPMVSWENMMFKHPYYFKMWEMEGLEGATKWVPLSESDWACSRTNQVIRYAEVLLIYAEAQAMADGVPNALAYECVNLVRNRAKVGLNNGVNPHVDDLQPGLSATAFRDSVFVERGWEFAGFEYASRWFDLVRLELVEDAAKEQPEHTFLPGRSPEEWPVTNPPTHESYFLPIPEADVLLNPNLKYNNNEWYEKM